MSTSTDLTCEVPRWDTVGTYRGEDDELSKLLIYAGITEPVTHPDAIILDVRSLACPLRVLYALPYTEPGTSPSTTLWAEGWSG